MAGVKVIQLIGDNQITAKEIAKDCNIFQKKTDLDKIRPEEIEENTSEINGPEKKATLSNYQSFNHIQYLEIGFIVLLGDFLSSMWK